MYSSGTVVPHSKRVRRRPLVRVGVVVVCTVDVRVRRRVRYDMSGGRRVGMADVDEFTCLARRDRVGAGGRGLSSEAG